VSENRVLKRLDGPKEEDVGGRWRKLHNEELHNLYSEPNIRGWDGRDTWSAWGKRDINRISYSEIMYEKDFLVDLRRDRKVILKCGLSSTSSGYNEVAGSWDQVNTQSGSIKMLQFLDYMREYQLLSSNFYMKLVNH